MRMYTMPPDSTEKEKIFGGIFTFAQVIQFAVKVHYWEADQGNG